MEAVKSDGTVNRWTCNRRVFLTCYGLQHLFTVTELLQPGALFLFGERRRGIRPGSAKNTNNPVPLSFMRFIKTSLLISIVLLDMKRVSENLKSNHFQSPPL